MIKTPYKHTKPRSAVLEDYHMDTINSLFETTVDLVPPAPQEPTTHQKLVHWHERLDELAGKLSTVPYAEDPKTTAILIAADMAEAWTHIAELDPARHNREQRDTLLVSLALASTVHA